MDTAALWQRYQEWLYYHQGLGFYLDVSRMRFDAAFVEAIQPKFEKAFQDMAALEKGAIANPDENRMVGHYWLRDPDLAPTAELTQDIVQTLEQIEAFAQKVHTGAIHPPQSHHDLLILSPLVLVVQPSVPSLSPQLSPQTSHPLAIHFIDNTDPAGIDRILTHSRKAAFQHPGIGYLQIWRNARAT